MINKNTISNYSVDRAFIEPWAEQLSLLLFLSQNPFLYISVNERYMIRTYNILKTSREAF